MRLTIHNLLMRLGSPAAHAIFMGLAIAFMSISAQAAQLLVIDRLDCPACIAFKQDVTTESYEANEVGARTPMVVVSFLNGRLVNEPPEWFIPAMRDGRIQEFMYTPTFILLDDDHREVGRFIGYRNPEWFFERLEVIVTAHEASQ